MTNETRMTIVGFLGADPELRFTNGGDAVANFSVGSTPSRFNKNTNLWEKQPTIWMECSVWRAKAELVAETFKKGSLVIVVGTIRANEYEDRTGVTRSKLELVVEECGLAIKPGSPTGSAAPVGAAVSSANPWGTAD